MSSTLNSMEKACGQNVIKGLGQHIYIQCIADIASIETATDFERVTAPSFVTPADGFHKWGTSGVLSKNTYKCEQLGDADGKSYKTTVVVFIPGLSKEKTKILHGTAGCGHLVLTYDKSKKLREIGEIDNGADITFVEDNNGDTNGYLVTINWESGEPPYFATYVVPAQS